MIKIFELSSGGCSTVKLALQLEAYTGISFKLQVEVLFSVLR